MGAIHAAAHIKLLVSSPSLETVSQQRSCLLAAKLWLELYLSGKSSTIFLGHHGCCQRILDLGHLRSLLSDHDSHHQKLQATKSDHPCTSHQPCASQDMLLREGILMGGHWQRNGTACLQHNNAGPLRHWQRNGTACLQQPWQLIHRGGLAVVLLVVE